ncbi:MAG: hypothetical protein JNL98_15815 [Bryobacterales bacterium]|nr:hypothetical protein [Bryobacterales bacterium]
MSEFSHSLPPDVEAEDEKPRPKSRKWFWISAWMVSFFVLPALLVGVLHRERERIEAASRDTVGSRKSPVAPPWVPVRDAFRVDHASAGSAILHSEETIANLVVFYEHRLRQNSFQVSSNLMEQDHKIFAAILNASDANDHVLLVTLRGAESGTRIELTFKEGRKSPPPAPLY